jgi:hypothetical protein
VSVGISRDAYDRQLMLGLAGRYALVCAVKGGLSLKRATARFKGSPATAYDRASSRFGLPFYRRSFIAAGSSSDLAAYDAAAGFDAEKAAIPGAFFQPTSSPAFDVSRVSRVPRRARSRSRPDLRVGRSRGSSTL